MMVTFESKVGRITMFGDVAVQLIRMMGRPGTVPSALLAVDIPEALESLHHALRTVEDTAGKPTSADAENDNEPQVSLHHRAYPLIKLLEDAVTHNSDVMWERQDFGAL
jgi:hypothetical protein